ncbi:MAG: sulfite exporter TauE/SafE family protein [Pseudomonadota bacterium]
MFETVTLTSGLALTFGILHALEPGHGKTALMTYLASGKRSVSEGVVIALTSAITHSFAVLLIALGSHYLLHHGSSEKAVHGIGDMLALVSGALIAGLGIWTIRKAWRDEPTHQCASCGGHHHDHHHSGDHHHNHAHNSKKKVNKYFASTLLGFATGIIPCPTVVVAFLAGVSTGNSFAGLQSVLLFALGMGVSLLTVILLFSFGALKVRTHVQPKTSVVKWGYVQGVVFLLIGALTAFYH